MSIVVTGASGFIGRAVVQRLLDEGRRVVSLGRTDPGIPGLAHVTWDVREAAGPEVLRALPYLETVIHCAGIVDDWADADELHAVNVIGTRHVLDAFPDQRIIHLSSTEVYDPQRDHDRLYEEAGPVAEARYPSGPELSKALAETVIQRVRPQTLVLRPSVVYGPGDTTLFPRLRAIIEDGQLRIPGGGRKRITLTHIDTLVEAMLAGIARPDVSGPINVGDPKPYVLKEALLTYLARAGEERVVLDEVPADLAMARAWYAERRARKKGTRPPITRTTIRQVIHERTYDLTRLEQQLGCSGVQHLAPRRA